MSFSRYEPYIVEILRLAVLVIFVSFAGYFIKFLPFVSELPFIKSNYTLAEFIEFVVFGVISFLLIEFSFRVEKKVNDMIDFIPRVGVIHRYSFFIVSGILLYSGWINTFMKIVGEDWVWIYQMFFATFTILMFIVIFVIIYREGENFGKNILSKFKGLM